MNCGEGEFGNAIRGPLGVHRANMHRYWFEEAAPDLQSQFAYLRGVKRLTAEELGTFIEGLSIPEEFQSLPKIEQPVVPFDGGRGFQILDYVQVKRKASNNWWTQCPSCARQGHDRSGDNLAISVGDPRFLQVLGRLHQGNDPGGAGRPDSSTLESGRRGTQ